LVSCLGSAADLDTCFAPVKASSLQVKSTMTLKKGVSFKSFAAHVAIDSSGFVYLRPLKDGKLTSSVSRISANHAESYDLSGYDAMVNRSALIDYCISADGHFYALLRKGQGYLVVTFGPNLAREREVALKISSTIQLAHIGVLQSGRIVVDGTSVLQEGMAQPFIGIFEPEGEFSATARVTAATPNLLDVLRGSLLFRISSTGDVLSLLSRSITVSTPDRIFLMESTSASFLLGINDTGQLVNVLSLGSRTCTNILPGDLAIRGDWAVVRFDNDGKATHAFALYQVSSRRLIRWAMSPPNPGALLSVDYDGVQFLSVGQEAMVVSTWAGLN